jgi:hypothetical protein
MGQIKSNQTEWTEIMSVTIGVRRPIKSATSVGHIYVSVTYAEDDPIWNLAPEKQERKALADAQRALALKADELAQTKVVERG